MAIYKQDGNKVLCNIPADKEVVFFIPEVYFSNKSAQIMGDYVSLIGIFNYCLWDPKTEKPVGPLKTFKYQTVFVTKPYVIDKPKNYKLTASTPETSFRLMRYRNGDILVHSIYTPQEIEHVEEFFKLFVITGNIPTTIDYREIYYYFPEAMALSGNSFGLSMQMFGIMQSELCRDPKDIKKPFRLSSSKKNGQWTNYQVTSIKDIPKYTSAYTSLTSEYYDDAVMYATMLKGDDNKFTPLENVFTGKW